MPPTEKQVFKRMNLPGTSHVQTILTLGMETMWNLLHQATILTCELFEIIYFPTTLVKSHIAISLSFAPEFMSQP